MQFLSSLDLAVRLISFPSITPEDAGCLEFIHDYLNHYGFHCRFLDFDGDEGSPTRNLYAKFGDGSDNLCFAGHTDVVPPGDFALWSSHPFRPEVRDGYLYGRGAEDMKGAIACFITAALSIRSQLPEGSSISLLLTGDEEGNAINGTKKALQALSKAGEKISACLVGEPTNPQKIGQMAKIGRRGSITFNLKIKGTQGHVAYPHLADNPVSKLVYILKEICDLNLDNGNDYFQPSNLEITNIEVGNSTDNLIPEAAHATFNIRFNDMHSSGSLVDLITAKLNSSGYNYELKYRVSGESFITPPGDLSSILSQAILQECGAKPELSTTGGTSDARFIKDYCPVIEFGTTGRTAHKIDENVSVQALQTLTSIYQNFISGYFKRSLL